MATTVVDGTTYTVPDNGARGWGTEVSNLLKALGDNSLLIKGGSIPLTSDADFGATYGLKSAYFSSRVAQVASAGLVRLGNTDSIKWRNAGNTADLTIAVASDRVQFEGVDLVDLSTSQTLTNKTVDASANTLSNVDTTMWAAGVLITDTGLVGAADTNVPSTLAVKTYIDAQIGGKDDASEITYTPTTVGDWTGSVDPGNVDGGLDQLATRATAAESHAASTSNPHSVTAAQVGLGNVDNTSDANKPVSTAQQTALDAKANNTITITAGAGLTGGGDLTANRTLDVNVDGSTLEVATDTVQVKALGIGSSHLATNAVTTAKITDANVTAAKLATDSVETAKIVNANVTSDKLATNSVTTAKITDANVTSAKLESNIILPGNEKVRVPVGTTLQRPSSPAQGDLRFNTTATTLEVYDGTAWDSLPGAGGGSQPDFLQNSTGTTYTSASSGSNILAKTSVPSGTYQLTFGGDFESGTTGFARATLFPRFNATNVTMYDSGATPVRCGFEGNSATTIGFFCKTVIVKFTGGPATFDLNLLIDSGCQIQRPYWVLTRIDVSHNEITTEWN